MPGNGDQGWFVAHYQTWGQGNVDIVKLNLDIPPTIADSAPADTGALLYAPTNHPQGGCLELTVVYWRKPGYGTTRALGWWDWCRTPPGWVTFESMDNTPWTTSYVSTEFWLPEAQTEDLIYWGLMSVAGTNCMRGILFNFTYGHYDEKAYSCGTPAPGYAAGWSMWESYHVMDRLANSSQCPIIPRLDPAVFVVTDTTTSNWQWKWLDQANISPLGPFGLCWTSGSYNLYWFTSPTDRHAWRAFTP